MILAGSSGVPDVLFVERALNERDPWSGNLAFPGGRVEPGETLRQTAERETWEETGIDLNRAQLLGRLADIIGARLPIRVACFVYAFSGSRPVVAINHESSDALWVSLSDLADTKRHVITTVRFSNRVLEVPAFILPEPGKPVLWGITYRLLMQFMELHGLVRPDRRI
jgi:8-oxo-dGTP pyrophosphatase MutT (NUDIX family)